MQKIRKAVIPAAGFGTRFLPATKATPKDRKIVYTGSIDEYFDYKLGPARVPRPALRDGAPGGGESSGCRRRHLHHARISRRLASRRRGVLPGQQRPQPEALPAVRRPDQERAQYHLRRPSGRV